MDDSTVIIVDDSSQQSDNVILVVSDKEEFLNTQFIKNRDQSHDSHFLFHQLYASDSISDINNKKYCKNYVEDENTNFKFCTSVVPSIKQTSSTTSQCGMFYSSSDVEVNLQDLESLKNDGLCNDSLEEFPSAIQFGVHLKLTQQKNKNIGNKSSLNTDAFPNSPLKMNFSENNNYQPFLIFDDSVKSIINFPLLNSTMGARNFFISEEKFDEPGCIACKLFSKKGRVITVCCMIFKFVDLFTNIFDNLTSAHRTALLQRVTHLKSKYEAFFIISIGLDKTLKQFQNIKNNAYRQLVDNDFRPTKHKTKKSPNIPSEIIDFFESQGNVCNESVYNFLNKFEFETHTSIIQLKDSTQVIEWLFSLQKSIRKREEKIIEKEDFADQTFIVNSKKIKKSSKTKKGYSKRFFIHILEQFPYISHQNAKAIAGQHATFHQLRNAIQSAGNNPEFISNITYKDRRKSPSHPNQHRVGSAASRKLFTFLTSNNPNELIN